MESLNKSNLPSNSKKDFLRYAGLGTQMLAAIGVAVFLGIKADEWLHTSPLITAALPLLVLFGIFYKLIRQTGKKDNERK
jgi:F0F1-type ATP synthase assembly protein I